ncbi:MAG: BlaI/MecI/CopY family transcriptional regulator [Planctomycetota bacterium]
MPRQPSEYPTRLELEILKILWDADELTVRTIRQRLSDAGRDSAHTSVITILNIMVDKGYVAKRKDGKSYLFWAIVDEPNTMRAMLGDFVDRAFDGSPQLLVSNLLGDGNIEREELLELRKLINQTLKKRG